MRSGRVCRRKCRRCLIRKSAAFVINAAKIARECGLAARINTVMQMAFFHLTNILPGDSALMELQGAIAKSYSSKGRIG